MIILIWHVQNQCVTSEKQTSVWTFLSQNFRGVNQLPSRAPNSVMRDNDYANMSNKAQTLFLSPLIITEMEMCNFFFY